MKLKLIRWVSDLHVYFDDAEEAILIVYLIPPRTYGVGWPD